MKQLSRYCMLAALASVVGLGALVPLPTGAKASLIGDTVDCDMQPNNIWSCNQASAVVAAGGPEFTLDLNQTTRFHVDVGVSSVLLTWVAAGGFTLGASDVFTLSSLDWVDKTRPASSSTSDSRRRWAALTPLTLPLTITRSR